MIKKTFLPLIFSSLLIFQSLTQAAPSPSSPFLFGTKEPSHIEINNRILSVVNGKPITVYDLAKKLDISFYQQYPQYAESIGAKYQYYNQNWKAFLRDLIDKELILSEASELKMPLTAGDIREEMEKLFGPNIISNLDKIGLSYEEAQEIVQSDIILNRMLGYRVHMKTLKKITPQMIIQAYNEYCQKNIRLQEWEYNILSIRHPDTEKGAEISNIVYELVTVKNMPFTEVPERLKALGLYDKDLKLNFSATIKHNEKEISENYKKILVDMKTNSFTPPLKQLDRDGVSTLYRIFYLDKTKPGGNVPFEEVEQQLTDHLRGEIAEQETKTYLENLRKHFLITDEHFNPVLPQDYELFTLK